MSEVAVAVQQIGDSPFWAFAPQLDQRPPLPQGAGCYATLSKEMRSYLSQVGDLMRSTLSPQMESHHQEHKAYSSSSKPMATFCVHSLPFIEKWGLGEGN